MRLHVLHVNIFSFLCILVLHRATEISSASLEFREISQKRKFPDNGTRPTNLAELIEYVPANFPLDIANITVTNELEEQESDRRIITIKLKTHLTVESNKNNNSQTNSLSEQTVNVGTKSNDSGDHLSDIEYVPLGLSLDNPDEWRKRWYERGKVEPNESKYSLSDIEYVPGGSSLDNHGSWETISYGGGKDEYNETELENIPDGLSLDDGGWKKNLYSRGKVERNDSKVPLSEIEYLPGVLSFENPGSHEKRLFGRDKLEPSETNASLGEDKYSSRTLEVGNDDSWEARWYGEGKAGSRESDNLRRESDYPSDTLASDTPDDSGENWYGPGTVEKLFYNNGKMKWKTFSSKKNELADENASEEANSSAVKSSREESYSSDKENVSEESNSSNDKEIPDSMDLTYDPQKNHNHRIVAKDTRRSTAAKTRQFVFHPYLPYGKDIPADEKIKFGDVLPIKMMKFVKSMVEEAPWEQMFIKMVRMVVDQFVDKIIEKMFSEKGGDHFKRRSLDEFFNPHWDLPTFDTPVIRIKRAVNANKHQEQDENEDIFSMVPPKRDEQDIDMKGKETEEERKTWLDHFLDFVFPNSKSDMPEEDNVDRLRKRDTRNAHLFKILVTLFLDSLEKTSGIIIHAKDSLRYKMLRDFFPYLNQKKQKPEPAQGSPHAVESIKMSHRKISGKFQTRNDVLENTDKTSGRRKRSTKELVRKEEVEKGLWQATSRRHRPHHHRSMDECSLRKACNAGRLLSRLPSVEDITLQLKSNGNEPHWDALIWGMKRKRCSRIFCKRQRSPKGSRYSWNPEKGRPSRKLKLEIVTEPPDSELDETDNLAS